LPEGKGGWLAGLRDPAVARALGVIHERYAEDLDVETLAREVGLSRTVLGERFVALLGEPPMRYCARWRMRMAANLLRDGKQNSANVAYAVGFNSEAAFNRAFKREYGDPPAAWRRKALADPEAMSSAPLPVQHVLYCTAHDGTRLAYSVVGEGPPLVKTANWLNHIEHDWESPIWRHWINELIPHHRLVRYDERGNGLSDWDTPDISFEAFVDDLDSVVEAAALEQFDLLGISQGAAVAIAYAVRNPRRVRRLVIFGGYACGWRVRAVADEVERREAMMTLARMGWGSDNPAYRQLFTGLYLPHATHEQAGWFNDMQRLSASPANAVTLQQVFSTIDVRDLLARVTTPTLVLHSRGDHAIPASQGEALAHGIKGALFELVESDNHLLIEDEPAWPPFIKRVRDFLEQDTLPGQGGSATPVPAAAAPMMA
jgi:pimeloyl-ACP methyl ester carboxylesterase/AraC-like DNA-binding protein